MDAGRPGATARSWGWLNASWSGLPDAYVRLRMAGMTGWRRLAAEMPDLPLAWNGALVWGEADLPALVARRAAQGYAMRLVDRAEAWRIEPALRAPPAAAAHCPADGAVEAGAAAARLLADAVARGARRVRAEAEVPEMAGGQAAGLRLVGGERIGAEAVVLACGAATAALAARAGVALRTAIADVPALLVATPPAPPLLGGLVVGEGLEARQRADGSLLLGGPLEPGDPDGRASAAALLARAGKIFAGAALAGGGRVRAAGVWAAARPIPRDGLPLAGEAAPGLWLCVSHSGATLAPALGAALAGEILGGGRDPLLAPFPVLAA